MTSTNTSPPAISRIAEPCSGPPASTPQSSQAIGTSTASDKIATIDTGRSRSSSATLWPAPRAALDAIAERMPPTTGPAILSNVQIAATPITPAPKKRTSWRKIVLAQSSALPGTTWCAVR